MKIAVFYYTQSGQALNVARSICSKMNDVSVVYKEIVPLTTYPFPWSKNAFFDAFPETRLGIPPSGIVPMDFSDVEDAGLVLVVGQSWFLSPSLPLQSFFTDEQVKQYLSGRKVVFVNACRNMWLMTSRKVKAYLSDAHAKMVGQIVLQLLLSAGSSMERRKEIGCFPPQVYRTLPSKSLPVLVLSLQMPCITMIYHSYKNGCFQQELSNIKPRCCSLKRLVTVCSAFGQNSYGKRGIMVIGAGFPDLIFSMPIYSQCCLWFHRLVSCFSI